MWNSEPLSKLLESMSSFSLQSFLTISMSIHARSEFGASHVMFRTPDTLRGNLRMMLQQVLSFAASTDEEDCQVVVFSRASANSAVSKTVETWHDRFFLNTPKKDRS